MTFGSVVSVLALVAFCVYMDELWPPFPAIGVAAGAAYFIGGNAATRKVK